MKVNQPVEIPAAILPPVNPTTGGNGLQVLEIDAAAKGATNKFMPANTLIIGVVGCIVKPDGEAVYENVSLGLTGISIDTIMPATMFIENLVNAMPTFVHNSVEKEITLECPNLNGATAKFKILYQTLNAFF